MDGDYVWEDYESMMEDYLPMLEDLEAMGIDPEELANLPEETIYQLLQQYGMDERFGNMGFESDMGMRGDEEFLLLQHLQDCTMPVAQQGLQMMVPLLLLCGSLRASSALDVPVNLLHFVCAFSGLFMLWNTFLVQAVNIVGVSLLAYVFLWCLAFKGVKNKGPVCGVVYIATLIVWELCLADPVQWHKIRGAQMILVMKVVSLGFDLDNGTVPAMIGLEAYLGYTLCVGTVIFGPWVSFGTYMEMLRAKPLSLRWALSVISNGVLAVICLVISTCLAPVMYMIYPVRWLRAYSDAASFRYSHYFVSYVSSTSSTLAGYGSRMEPDGTTKWEHSVVKPIRIEVPRSLVDVVTNWNLPMHYWLKHYVFKPSRNLGSFVAVIITYAASSILHGLNFQLAAVLLSLGLYSYVEYVFRKKLAEIFSACIKAKKCDVDCPHQYKSTNPWVVIANLLFGCLAVFHLAYLGVVFNTDSAVQEEGYTMMHTLDKWSSLNYASHCIMTGTYIFYWLIK